MEVTAVLILLTFGTLSSSPLEAVEARGGDRIFGGEGGGDRWDTQGGGVKKTLPFFLFGNLKGFLLN